jgi:hypothetical protein
MISDALEILRSEAGDYLKLLPELNLTGNRVVELSNVAKEDGSIAIPDNSLGLSLANIEEERVVRDLKSHLSHADGSISQQNPEIRLNLFVLFTANFNDYKTSLQFISGVIRFFQSKNVFTPANSPTMTASIEKLLVELYPLNLEQQNNLWAAIGAKYLPSVLYKIRAISIQEEQAKDQQLPLTAIQAAKDLQRDLLPRPRISSCRPTLTPLPRTTNCRKVGQADGFAASSWIARQSPRTS